VDLLGATETRLEGRIVWRHGVTHTRTIELEDRRVVVTDHLDGRGEHLISSTLPVVSKAVEIEPVGGLPMTNVDATAAERFYQQRSAGAVSLRGTLTLPATIGWRIGKRK
jgi:hypothetical protein